MPQQATVAGIPAALPHRAVEDPRYKARDYENVVREKMVEKLLESVSGGTQYQRSNPIGRELASKQTWTACSLKPSN